MEKAASARLALRSAYHLACIQGPDIGLVLPLPCEIGREGTGLAAALLSRRHASVRMRGSKVVLKDLGSSNGTCVRWGPFMRTLPANRNHTLMPGSRILAGSDVFVVRARPASLTRNRGRKSRPSFLFFLPFVSLSVLFFSRILSSFPHTFPFLFVLGFALVTFLVFLVVFVVRHQRRERDPAGLALHLAMLAAASGHSAHLPQQHSLRLPLPPGAVRRKVDAGSPESPRAIACIGPEGTRMADGIAASLIARLGGAVLRLPDGRRLLFGHERVRIDIIDTSSAHHCPADLPVTKDDLPCFRIGIAATIEQAPEWGEVILHARSVSLTAAWWDQFAAEDPAQNLPDCLDLAALLEAEQPCAEDGRRGLGVAIGKNTQGVVRIDLVRDGPHALIAGSTGSGKSEALLTWLKALCSVYSPEELTLILIDYKGGAAFAPLIHVPHVEAVFTDLSPEGTARAIRGLLALVRAREREFAKLKIPDYVTRCSLHLHTQPPPPRILVVVDEFASLIDTHPPAVEAMNKICAQGRSLGIHLIAATQRPAGAIPASMRQNLALRIALRCVTESDSVDLIGTPDAARLERVPGRAIIPGTGVFQFALSSRWVVPDWPVKATSLPWAPHFPTAIALEDLRQVACSSAECSAAGGTPIALVDGIEEGAHRALMWQDGQILIRTDPDEAELAARTARSLGAAIALSRAMPLHCLHDVHELSVSAADQAEDFLVACELACQRRAQVLVIPDLVEIRRLLSAVYGPLRGDELLAEQIRTAQACACVIVAAWPGGGSGESLGGGQALLSSAKTILSRSSDPFETIGARTSHTRALARIPGGTPGDVCRPTSPHHWWIRDPHGDSRLACLPHLDPQAFKTPDEAIRSWTEAKYSERKALLATSTEAVILFGSSWRRLDPEEGDSWLIIGDRDNLAQRALNTSIRGRGLPTPQMRTLPATSWIQAVSDEDSQLLIFHPSTDVIRAFAHAPIPLPPMLQHRCEDPHRGLARWHGCWFRAGIVTAQTTR